MILNKTEAQENFKISSSVNISIFSNSKSFKKISVRYLTINFGLKYGSYPPTLKFLFFNSFKILKPGESLISPTSGLYDKPQTSTDFSNYFL